MLIRASSEAGLHPCSFHITSLIWMFLECSAMPSNAYTTTMHVFASLPFVVTRWQLAGRMAGVFGKTASCCTCLERRGVQR